MTVSGQTIQPGGKRQCAHDLAPAGRFGINQLNVSVTNQVTLLDQQDAHGVALALGQHVGSMADDNKMTALKTRHTA